MTDSTSNTALQQSSPTGEASVPSTDANVTALAIVGIGCHFPDATTHQAFWENLTSGRSSVRELSDDEISYFQKSEAWKEQENFVRRGVILDGYDCFDAEFFNLSVREAQVTDPQQRLLLQVAYHCLEDAGYANIQQSQSIGVYVGTGSSHYLFENVMQRPDVMQAVGSKLVQFGNDPSFSATQLAYRLALTGPAMTINTACSTSLVALHQAAGSLARGECLAALVGASSISKNHGTGYVYQPGNILAEDGVCRPFDAHASGTVSGSGAGMVLVKTCQQAQLDGDHVYACIKATAINNDGNDKVAFSAPSVSGQTAVIQAALRAAKISPLQVSYIETHGTGTNLGDPIEIDALHASYGCHTEAAKDAQASAAPIYLGALKANVGHMGSAAGIGGLIKTALSLYHRQRVGQINFETVNPHLDLANKRFDIVTQTQEWQSNEFPRTAALSAFGMGGTNAHVILTELPAVATEQLSKTERLVNTGAIMPVSYQDADDAIRGVALMRDYWLSDAGNQVHWQRQLYSAVVGRQALSEKRVLVKDSQGNVSEHQAFNVQQTCWVFPGQGVQHAQMGDFLYQQFSVYKATFDRLAEAFLPLLGQDLRTLIFSEDSHALLNDTRYTQAAIFAVSYSIAKTLQSLGATPDNMIGHSIGEWVAACVAGVVSEEDAVKIVAKRAELMAAMPEGSMLAIHTSLADVQAHLEGAELSTVLDIAAINGPSAVTVSGEAAHIQCLSEYLNEQDVVYSQLHVSHGFHSAMMQPAANAFEAFLASVTLNAPAIKFMSSVTGNVIEDSQAQSPAYWAGQLRNTVQFAAAVEAQPADSLLAVIGPNNSFVKLLQSIRPNDASESAHFTYVVGSCPSASSAQRAPSATGSAVNTEKSSTMRSSACFGSSDEFFKLIATHACAGRNIDWLALVAAEHAGRTPLPVYPFKAQRCWLDVQGKAQMQSGAAMPAAFDADPTLHEQPHDWFMQRQWKVLAENVQQHLLQAFPSRLSLVDALSNYHLCIASSDDKISQALKQGFQALGQSAQRVHLQSGAASSASISLDCASDKPVLLLFASTEVDNADSQQYLHSQLSQLSELVEAVESHRGSVWLTLTQNAYSVLGADVPHPAHTAIAAATRVIGQEVTQIRAKVLDISETTFSTPRAIQQLAGFIARYALFENAKHDETALKSAAPLISSILAWRDSACFEPSYTPVLCGADQIDKTAWRANANDHVLITGGLGGLGGVIATQLAQQGVTKLTLLQRSQSDTPAALAQSIAGLGATLQVVRADVSDKALLATALAQAATTFGAITGVVHSAGVAGGGLILKQDHEQINTTLQAKVQGTLNLAELLDFTAMNFVLLCSSQNALKGGIGRLDYTAANAFLDGFAHQQNLQHQAPVLSINWATLADVGMAVEAHQQKHTDDAKDPQWQGALSNSDVQQVTQITSWLAQQSQEVWLDGGLCVAQCIVSKLPFEQVLFHTEGANLQAARQKAQQNAPGVSQSLQDDRKPRPTLDEPYQAPQSDDEKAVCAIWEDILGIDGIGVNDNFFSLGANSLMVIQSGMRIKETLSVELPSRAVYAVMNIAQTCELIAEHRPKVDDSLDALMAELDSASADDIESLLSQFDN